MKATGREIAVWFLAHLIWWAVAVLAVYPFFITPLYQMIFTRDTPIAQRTFYMTAIGFGLAVVGWCVALLIFLSARGSAPKAAVPPSPILGSSR